MGNFEEILISFAAAFTAAVLATIIANRILRKATRDPARRARLAAFGKKASRVFTQSIYGVLALGLVWTVYFMVLGLVDEARAEYAANAATLIVSVLTVFSIMIAFIEFMGRGRKDAETGDDAPGEDDKPQ